MTTVSLLLLLLVSFQAVVLGFITTSFRRQTPAHHSRLCMDGRNWADALGAQPPLGFWDPLGLLKDADQSRFDFLRYVETKHGRIAMLAILGHLVTTVGYRLPGDIFPGVPFASIRTGLAAFEDLPVTTTVVIIALIGLMEVGYGTRQEEIEDAQLQACEKFGWDEEEIAWQAAIELNNGRAAQMGILGLMVHEKIDNNPYIINSLLGYYKVDFNAAFTLAKSVTTDSSVLDSSTEANVPAAISSLAEAAASLATATNEALGL